MRISISISNARNNFLISKSDNSQIARKIVIFHKGGRAHGIIYVHHQCTGRPFALSHRS